MGPAIILLPIKERSMDQELVREFSKQWYIRGSWNTHYRGIPIWKNPMDMWILQEILFTVRPDIIIETGTHCGGSALYYSHVLDTLGLDTKIHTIDVEPKQPQAKHERINYITGSSLDEGIHAQIIGLTSDKKKVMVILDSLHTFDHVLKELELYAPLVSVGSYCIVEDTNVVEPMKAVFAYLKDHDDFVIDENCHKHVHTFNPNGFLERVK